MVLQTLPNIAQYLGVSRLTAWRWVKHEALPVTKTPRGHYMTSTDLLNDWIRLRGEEQRKAGDI